MDLRMKTILLSFYFHDTVSGASLSTVRVAGHDPSSWTFFGMVNVMDDLLTEGPEPGSAAVGCAQGLYMEADQAELGFLQTMNLRFYWRCSYNGSTLGVLGRNCPLTDIPEMPVVGGTGAFRFTHRYAQARTHWLDFKTGDATI
ncbi:hypothetical protein VPH35_072057 [Triticum aestivum]